MQRKSILLISRNEKIKFSLLETGYFKDVAVSDSLSSRLLTGVDILILDDKVILYSRYIQNYALYFKKIKSNFYITSDIETYATIYKKLSSYGIIVLPPELTGKQICDKICSATVERFSVAKSIACFWGAGQGAGVEMLSTSIAQVLSGITGKDTALLILNGDEGISYINPESATHGLSDIKDKLKNNILSGEELKNTCIKRRKLYILPGEKDIYSVRYYHPDDIEKLISLSLEVFDVVLINCGSVVNGMNISALNSASFKYLITTQSDKYYRNFKRLKDQIFSNLGINASDFSLIINKYIDSDGLLNEIDIARNYGMYLIGTVPHLDYEVGLAAERDRKTLTDYSSKYGDSIKAVAHFIAKDLKIEISEVKKNPNILKKLGDKLFGR